MNWNPCLSCSTYLTLPLPCEVHFRINQWSSHMQIGRQNHQGQWTDSALHCLRSILRYIVLILAIITAMNKDAEVDKILTGVGAMWLDRKRRKSSSLQSGELRLNCKTCSHRMSLHSFTPCNFPIKKPGRRKKFAKGKNGKVHSPSTCSIAQLYCSICKKYWKRSTSVNHIQ